MRNVVLVLVLVGCESPVPVGESSAAICNPNIGPCPCSCTLPHASTTCVDFDCSVRSCNAGWGNCDGDDYNGCEVSLTTVSNCGSCGHACGVGQACVSGACVTTSCPSGYKLCGTTCIPSTGCCSNTECVPPGGGSAMCYANECWFKCGTNLSSTCQ